MAEIPELSESIYKRLAENVPEFAISVPDGWKDLVNRADAGLATIVPDYTILQIKEKFGGLRYYVSGITADMQSKVREVLDEYERMSFYICEVCGEQGNMTSTGWIRTLCDLHLKEHNKDKDE